MGNYTSRILHALILFIGLGSVGCLMNASGGGGGLPVAEDGEAEASDSTIGASAASLFAGLDSSDQAGLAAKGQVDFDFCSDDFSVPGIRFSNDVAAGHYGRPSAGVTVAEDTVCPPWKSWEIEEVRILDCTSGEAAMQGGDGIFTMDFAGVEAITEIYGRFVFGGREFFCDMTIGRDGFDAVCEDGDGNPVEPGYGVDYCSEPPSAPPVEGPEAGTGPDRVPVDEVCYAEASAHASASSRVTGDGETTEVETSAEASAEAYSYGYGCEAESYAYAEASADGVTARAEARVSTRSSVDPRRYDRNGELLGE